MCLWWSPDISDRTHFSAQHVRLLLEQRGLAADTVQALTANYTSTGAELLAITAAQLQQRLKALPQALQEMAVNEVSPVIVTVCF